MSQACEPKGPHFPGAERSEHGQAVALSEAGPRNQQPGTKSVCLQSLPPSALHAGNAAGRLDVGQPCASCMSCSRLKVAISSDHICSISVIMPNPRKEWYPKAELDEPGEGTATSPRLRAFGAESQVPEARASRTFCFGVQT